MIRSNGKVYSLEVGSEVCDGPYDRKTLLLRRRVVPLSGVQGPRPISQGERLSIRLELQQATAKLPIRRVRIKSHLSLRAR